MAWLFFNRRLRAIQSLRWGMRELLTPTSCSGNTAAFQLKRLLKKRGPRFLLLLNLNDRLAEGYISRATLFGDFEWNWSAAEGDYRKAIELNPNSATAHHWYALQLAQLGRTDEALQANHGRPKARTSLSDHSRGESENPACWPTIS